MELFIFCGILLILFIFSMCITKGPKENLQYLKQYESQDEWRNNPEVWPIVQNPAMANYEIERKFNERLARN